MKLYAKVASERATKGQGGNEYLDIDITVESKDKQRIHLAQLTVRPDEHGIGLYDQFDNLLFHNVLDVYRHTTINKSHDSRTCINSVPCIDCENVDRRIICSFNDCKNLACEESGHDICKKHFLQGIND